MALSFREWRRDHAWGTTTGGLASRAAAVIVVMWLVILLAATGIRPTFVIAVIIYTGFGLIGFFLLEFLPWRLELRGRGTPVYSRRVDRAVILPLCGLLILVVALILLTGIGPLTVTIGVATTLIAGISVLVAYRVHAKKAGPNRPRTQDGHP